MIAAIASVAAGICGGAFVFHLACRWYDELERGGWPLDKDDSR